MPYRIIRAAIVASIMAGVLPAAGAETAPRPEGHRLSAPRPAGSEARTVSLLPIGSSTLTVGTPIAFRLATSRTGYVHLYALDASGRTQVWIENMKLRGNTPYTYPPRGLTVRATPPAGDETIVLVATREPIDGFAGPGTTRPFDTQLTHDGFRQALAAKTGALPRPSWAFTEAHISVRD